MIGRGDFLLVGGAAVAARLWRADPQADPAMRSSGGQSLRVLLGRGSVQPLDSQTFLFNGRRYRGSYTYAAGGQVVNLVPVEQYLYGVIAREMPRTWPAAALEVQAIVARTYVLQRSDPRREYDLVPSQSDQVYTGMDAEAPACTAAVDATAGQVLQYASAFASVSYSSCCGGHTESAADAWGGSNAPPYLEGLLCPYCSDSPWFRWTHAIAAQRVRAAFPAQSAAAGTLRSLVPGDVDASGRAGVIRFLGDAGEASVRAAVFRSALGTRTVASLLLRRIALGDEPSGPAVTLEGAGLGHGVGLCQWGARGMALRGADARAIAAFYFPGTVVGND